jgi:ligand-binding sensor domain-containing protein
MPWLLNSIRLLILILSLVIAQGPSPSRFSLKNAVEDTFLTRGLKSNIVAEIRIMGDSLTWFGTGQGLALHDGHRIYAHQITAELLDDGQLTNLVPQGGIPAIAVMGDTMVVAFSGDDGSIQMGLGLTLTHDAGDTNGITWIYLEQPVDNVADTLVPFGEGYYRQLPVTVQQANVSYDASLSDDYLWIASWAGGLRR